ncbi:class I SAM-dependent methyltransferase [Achromobacter sp. GG226]|uniref:class I SAM-dependent methyltransferase n=1 Tax=Verticiella alkaliphila TaxID=2779529 RepID=UPI001C0B4FEC|nr:class I SAM-dependent methyltransferase [Verticiella sp. GG226]MBU4613120.1 class I SAM-dependent methyltransferase [Verticiella sp. GG226]
MTWNDGYVADIGYTHGFYRELSPSMLAFATRERGLAAPSPDAPLTYCELGCGQGVTANLLAAANPQLQVYANDFNPAHIAGAQRLANRAGIDNVHFLEHSFEEMRHDDSLPMFDIITLHGIYSWVAEPHREHIRAFIQRRLKPGGLVYVSYNAMPGWAAVAPLRHLMYLQAQSASGTSTQKVPAALSFAKNVIDAQGAFFRTNKVATARFERIQTESPAYLAHEYLNDVWQPFYFADIARAMGEAKLTYAGSTNLVEQLDAVSLTPEQSKLLADISDLTLRETTRDYLINQQFRRDIFVKGRLTLSNTELEESWRGQRLALVRAPSAVNLKVRTPRGEADLEAAYYVPVIEALAEGPRTVGELLKDHRVKEVGPLRLRQALQILLGSGQIDTALDALGEEQRRSRTDAFNAAVLHDAEHGGELRVLASPVTGGAVPADRVTQLFLLARSQGATDYPAFAWQHLKQRGQRLKQGDTPIHGDEANLAELATRHSRFEGELIPLLKQLGIVD